MKKICLVKYDMKDASGGARVCANLANALSQQYEVHVVSICSQDADTFYKLDNNVRYSVLVQGEGRIRKVLPKGIAKLRKYIKNEKIDIAFAIGISICPFVVGATIFTTCKSVACEHINCLNGYENDLGQKICRSIGVKFCDKIVTLTKMDRDAYCRKYHLKTENVEYIYNWIDESLINRSIEYKGDSKNIISVGRLEPVKGIENIIEVSRRLKKEHPDWQWHVYGSGEENYVSELHDKINMYGLEDFVHLKGKVNDIYDRYSQYSLCVLTSYCEGLPMVLLEAKSQKLPIISFDCLTGPRDIVRDGIDGFLVEEGDLDELYDKLNMCMTNEKCRASLSEETTGNIELFAKDSIVKKWIAFIDKC